MNTNNSNGKVKFELEVWNRGISDDQILDDIRHVAHSLNLDTFTYDQYRQHGRFSDFLIRTRFGSWNNSLVKAGLSVQRLMKIPEEKLFENIERVWMKLGRQPRRAEMRKPLSLFFGSTYERRFGTWRKALEEFVKFINSSSDDMLLESSVQRTTQKSIRQPNLRLRFLVMKRDNFKCCYCGRSPATHPNVELQVDHVIAWSEGGQTVLGNLQTLCSECNLGKSNQSPT